MLEKKMMKKKKRVKNDSLTAYIIFQPALVHGGSFKYTPFCDVTVNPGSVSCVVSTDSNGLRIERSGASFRGLLKELSLFLFKAQS